MAKSEEKIERRIVMSKEAARITGLTPQTIYKMSRDGEFPRGKRIRYNRRGWWLKDVIEWVESRGE